MNHKTLLSTSDVSRANFTCNAEAKYYCDELKKKLAFTAHYEIARLAIGRSMVLKTFPNYKKSAESRSSGSGLTIKGDFLFGRSDKDRSLWITFLIDNLHRHDPTASTPTSHVPSLGQNRAFIDHLLDADGVSITPTADRLTQASATTPPRGSHAAADVPADAPHENSGGVRAVLRAEAVGVRRPPDRVRL